MTTRTKKILLISAFIIIILLMALALYWFFFRPVLFPPAVPPTVAPAPPSALPPTAPAAPVAVAPPAVNIPPGIPPEIIVPVPPVIPGPVVSFEAVGGITSYSVLEENATLSPTLANNGRDMLFYEKDTGFFYTITPDGEKKLFSDKPFKNVENVTWSPNNQKAILEYPDGSNLIYDFKQDRSITLPTHWKDFTFSNDSQQIAFKDMRLDKDNRYLAISDTNGTTYKRIEPLGYEDENVHITWSPNNKYVALFLKTVSFNQAIILPIGFNGENYRKLNVEGRDLKFEWSPSGEKLLYSAFNNNSDYNPSLWIVNTHPELLATGRTNLQLKTWADKCTFTDETTVYCAVPKELETGTGWLPSLADNTPDDFYKINVMTGGRELLAQPLFPTTVDKMFVSQDNKYLYWLEKNTGQIKKMNL